MREEDEFKDDTEYPVGASAGGDNAYYIAGCPVMGHRPAYASCLNKIESHERGCLDAIFDACDAGINWRRCPAVGMRQEEIEKGVAIYYISRAKLRGFSQYRQEINSAKTISLFASMTNRDDKKQYRPKSVEPPKTPTDPLAGAGDGYAAAINRAVEEESKRPATRPTVETKATSAPISVEVKPGESLIDLARRMRQQQAAA